MKVLIRYVTKCTIIYLILMHICNNILFKFKVGMEAGFGWLCFCDGEEVGKRSERERKEHKGATVGGEEPGNEAEKVERFRTGKGNVGKERTSRSWNRLELVKRRNNTGQKPESEDYFIYAICLIMPRGF